MRIIVSTVFLLLFFGSQIIAQDTANIEVVKFKWNIYIPQNEINIMERLDTRNPTSTMQITPVTIPRTTSNTTKRTTEKTVEERSRDLARIERAAVINGASSSGKAFLYELKIKNKDEKMIKSFVWEYQSAENPLRDDSNRQFLCVEKIKSNESETLRIQSFLPPTNVVEAADAKKKRDNNYASDILINRVEYTDGTVWQRPGWDGSKIALDSSLISEKLKFNKCAVL